MLIVIAKILDDNKKVEACRVINTATLKADIVSAQKLKGLVREGQEIIGFCKSYNNKVYTEGKNRFNYSKVPELNGAGDLKNPKDARLLTVYGWKGFAEMKKYYLFNYKGDIEVLDAEQFTKEVQAGNVNGATPNNKTGRPMLSTALDIELDN